MKDFDRNSEHGNRRWWKTLSFVLILALVFTTVSIQWPSSAQAGGTSVYLNGSGGSDSADGSSPDSAVKSFGRAKELAGSSGEILVCGTVYTSGDTTWSLPEGVSLKRAPGFSGAIVNISGTLTLKNISLGSEDISGSGSIAGNDEEETTPEVTKEPTAEPTKEPEVTEEPTAEPTKEPEVTEEPTAEPTKEPEEEPETTPEVTEEPTAEPTKEPETTPEVTEEPTAEPTKEPEEETETTPEVTEEPTAEPTKEPEEEPETTPEVTEEPTAEPTKEPEEETETTPEVTEEPTAEPTKEPEEEPEEGTEEETSSWELLEKLKVAVGSDEDVQAVLDAYRWYEGCTEEEKAMVPQELVIRLKKAQSACKIYNHSSSGISVSGDIPWYVQFRVTEGSQEANFDLGDLLGSYEMGLWNLLTDEPYELNGTKVTVTVPVSDAKDYEKVSVIHYLEDGSYEILTPEVMDGAIRFTTSSFSPYSITGQGRIAGSTVIVGPGDAVYNQSQGQQNQDAGQTGTSNGTSSSSGGSSSVVPAQTSGGADTSSESSRNTSSSESSNTRTASSVRTGDSSNLIPYIVVVVVAAALIVILIVAGKVSAKKNNKNKQ